MGDRKRGKREENPQQCNFNSQRKRTSIKNRTGLADRRGNIFQRIRDSQRGMPPIRCITEIPKSILLDCDNRLGLEDGEQIPVIISGLYESTRSLLDKQKSSMELYLTCMEKLKLLVKLLNSDSSQEYPKRSGQTRESRVIHAEVIYLFGGVEVMVQLLLLSEYYPTASKPIQPDVSHAEVRTKLSYHVLDVLHFMCICMGPDIAGPLSDREDLIFHLFTLMAEKSCFLKAATLLEDILGVKQTMISLSKIPNLEALVTGFDEEQLANFCRVLSIAVSDTDVRDEQPNLVAQDKANRNKTGVPVSDLNQELLVELPNFIMKLVKIACKRIDSASTGNMPNLFNEIAGWVTWLDSSLAFDALAEVSNDDGVYLNLPLHDLSAPIPQSLRTMHELVYKVEVLYVLCLLLTGKQRTKVHEMLSKFKLMAGLNLLFDKVIWRCNLRSRPLHGHNENCDCSPEVALKVQFLRLVHSFCDQNENKYLILTRGEINELNRISKHADIPPLDAVKDIDRSLLCTGQKGILSKLVDVLKKEPAESPFRFWMSRSVESFLRGKTSFTDQTFLLRKGLLEVILTNVISTGTKSKEVLQSNFDLLAELMKFNHVAFKRFNKFIETEEKMESFLKLVSDNIVDSNMFIRCLILTLDHFQKEQPDNYEYAMRSCRLLQFVRKRPVRVKFLIKLINTVNVEILTQENVSCLNTTIIFLMFAERSCELPEYLSDLRHEEQSQLKPGFLLQNFRELVFFWRDHYLHKDKDSTQLEKSSCIQFDKWKAIVNVLIDGDIKSPFTIAHYLDMDDLMTKDMDVDSATGHGDDASKSKFTRCMTS
ncbi:short transient receptor potential channel 4-associated protein-like [Asterias rubens]|uniref:short transient receptor potential channel 4-associated protein-like n=1 Tax=Asterias rubens TaxID=7604 RepID=UPI00145522A8|nr:short transient receptor potential channel 4-associated protein-like [Asterias rubens]